MSLRPMFEHAPGGWLAFELSILRRLQFRSVVNPFAGEPDLDVYLKRWGARVAVNDSAQWAWVRGVARVENNTERLTEEDVEVVLEDAYVPRHRLYNPSLRRWFGETDAWWFDNVRANADKLADERRRALALHFGMMVGDYVHSFDEETRELRQPLSRVFRRLWESDAAPVNNNERNTSSNKDARVFIAKESADLLFLRLPHPSRRGPRHSALGLARRVGARRGRLLGRLRGRARGPPRRPRRDAPAVPPPRRRTARRRHALPRLRRRPRRERPRLHGRTRRSRPPHAPRRHRLHQRLLRTDGRPRRHHHGVKAVNS